MVDFSPTFRLLCACCRWPHSSDQQAAMIAANAAGIDWPHFRALVKHHRVAGLVHQALRGAPFAVPDEVSQWLTDKARVIAHGGLAQLGETIRLQRLLAAAGIDMLAVKGVGLGLKVFGTVALKQSIDIDFVLRRDQVEPALQILKDAGYTLVLPFSPLTRNQFLALLRYYKEFGLRSRSGFFVDLHWGLMDNPALLDEAAVDWHGASIAIDANTALRTMGDGDLFAYLCGHGACHHWARLKWLADFNAILTQASPDQIEDFNRRAMALGTFWPALQAQMLCEILFGTPLAHRLKQPAQSRRAQRLVHFALRKVQMTSDDPQFRPMRAIRENMVSAKLGSGWRFWRGYWLAYSVQPTVIKELNLPERLIVLYPFIRSIFWLWFGWLIRRGRHYLLQKCVDTNT